MLKGDLKKQAILDTAEEMFFERGYTAVTIQDILDRLDTSKGSLYYHFESKQQILSALCAQMAQNSHDQFTAGHFTDGLDRLNAILYHALPFKNGGERMLSILLPLRDAPDESVIMDTLLREQRMLFYPDLLETLQSLRNAGKVYYRQSRLPDLMWDCYTALYRQLMRCAADIADGGKPDCVVETLECARFLWERVMDAPFGGIEILRADEALACISRAVNVIRHRTAQPESPRENTEQAPETEALS